MEQWLRWCKRVAGLVVLCCVSQSCDKMPEPLEVKGLQAYDYQRSANYGKSMAIFGGSFSCIEASNACKKYWHEMLALAWSDFGINGAGYSNLAQDPGVQFEIDECCRQGQKFDIYLLWSPSNDFAKVGDNIGQLTDYTEADGYDEAKRNTLLGGMNYCYEKIMEHNPNAQILLFTTLPIFNMGRKGYAPDYDAGIGLVHYVEAEIAWAERHKVSYLDLFSRCGFNLHTYGHFYSSDALHPSEAGYDYIKQLTAEFIAYPDE